MQALSRRNIQIDDSSQLGTNATATSIKLTVASNQIVIALSNGNFFAITASAPATDCVYTLPDAKANDTMVVVVLYARGELR